MDGRINEMLCCVKEKRGNLPDCPSFRHMQPLVYHVKDVRNGDAGVSARVHGRGTAMNIHASITLDNASLLRRFVTPNLLVYFSRKMPELSRHQIETSLCELLKFLILVRDFPGNIIFGKEIDEFWHLWIMQTREYEALCAALPGGQFRHHSSRDYPETALSWAEAEALIDPVANAEKDEAHSTAPRDDARQRFEQNAQRLLSFFASYLATFGPLKQEVIGLWPPLERLTTRLGWTAADLNRFLADQLAKSGMVPAGSKAVA